MPDKSSTDKWDWFFGRAVTDPEYQKLLTGGPEDKERALREAGITPDEKALQALDEAVLKAASLAKFFGHRAEAP